MPVSTSDTDRQAPTPPGTIESAAWWQPFPSFLGGVASVGGIFGLIPFDRRRFHPAIDEVMLRRDGTILMFEFKRARSPAAHELERENNAEQQRLFDPDAG